MRYTPLTSTFYPCFLAFIALMLLIPTGSAHAHGLNIPVLSKTCLPVEGRMLTDRSASCHCPPKSLCPANAQEWAEAKTLPPYIASVCCPRPERCLVSYHKNMPTKCPALEEAEPRVISACQQMEPVAVQGAQILDAADYDPALPKNIEQAKRAEASKTFNQCIANSCAGVLEALVSERNEVAETQINSNTNYSEKGYSGVQGAKPKIFIGEEIKDISSWAEYNKYKNAKELSDYLQCEVGCKAVASKVLGSTFSGKQLALLSTINNSDDFWEDDNDNRANFGAGLSDLVAYSSGVSLYTTPEQLPSSLDGKLECVQPSYPTVCVSYAANNGSCASCVSPDTLISMAEGKEKVIADIKKGDEVKTSGGLTAKVLEVVEKDWPSLTLYSINDGALKLTADHPIMTKIGWRAIDYNSEMESSMKKYGLQNVPNLKLGDFIKVVDDYVEVKSIEALSPVENGKTFNLRLESGSGFYANGVFVKSN